MSFKKYILHVETAWCGEYNDYGIIKDENSDISSFCEMTAYDNFNDFGGHDAILETLFPDEEEYTEEQVEQADAVENEYYSWSLDEFDENGDSEWEWYEVIYDESIQH